MLFQPDLAFHYLPLRFCAPILIRLHRKTKAARWGGHFLDVRLRLANRSREAAKGGGARRDRTADLVNAIHALSQLSYGPIQKTAFGNQQSAIVVFRSDDRPLMTKP
jgi:hypothetical protein